MGNLLKELFDTTDLYLLRIAFLFISVLISFRICGPNYLNGKVVQLDKSINYIKKGIWDKIGKGSQFVKGLNYQTKARGLYLSMKGAVGNLVGTVHLLIVSRCDCRMNGVKSFSMLELTFYFNFLPLIFSSPNFKWLVWLCCSSHKELVSLHGLQN